jgi:predicted RNA-binding protein Jag
VEYTYSGQASFAIPFSLGILNRAYVTIQINNQVDGSGDPLYYTNFTWTSDSEVVINGLTNGDIIKIARTIPSNLLLSDYTAGSNITRDNLNIANKQLIMLIHEVLDKNVTQQTKLDTIESGATADQTAAEIKTAYESNANTNAFTDADESKLDGIEAGADVTDTANVTAAGAVMDSEVSDLAGIKSVNVSTLQVKPAEGAFVDGDKTKLNTIETNADVTDTANVVAALTAGTNITIASDGTIASTAAGGGGGVSDIVEDLTPQLGGDLDLNNQDITGTGNISITGTVNGRTLGTDGTKLDAIEALADVTDTDNVVAALTAGTNVTIAADGTISSTDTNTTYTVGDGGLTTNDFTNADHSKLDGIEAGATADQTKADIDALNIDADTLDGQHGSYYTSYADTAVAGIVDSAPGTLDTLNELAQALGDDPNFATTTATNLSQKLPKAGGTMTGDILFNDNVKAKFGNSDLQIYHDSSHSYIKDSGTGNLFIDATSLRLRTGAGTETYLTADGNGSVDLYYDNAKKLETTSVGIDVTGTVVADKMFVEGTADTRQWEAGSAGQKLAIYAYDNSTFYHRLDTGNATNYQWGTFDNIPIYTITNNTIRTTLTNSGNFGIGSTNPTSLLHLAANAPYITFEDTDNNQDWQIQATAWFAIRDQTANAERMRIDSSGRVGVGLSAPTAKMHLFTDGVDQSMFSAQANLGVQNRILTLKSPVSDSTTQPFRWQTSNSILWEIDGTESKSMNLNSVGNLGLGTYSPTSKLSVVGDINSTKSGGSTLTLENSITSISANELIGGIDFKGNDTSEDGNEVLAFIRANALDTTPDSCIRFGTLQNNGGVDDVVTERMRLDNYGRLGIGTTSPNHELHIESTSPTIRLVDTDGNNTLDITQSGSACYIDFDNTIRFRNLANVERLRIDSNGIDVTGVLDIFDNNSDISPDGSGSGQLKIDGNGYRAAIALDADGVNLYSTSASRPLIFGVNETEVARVTSTGLDVTGDLTVSSTIEVGSLTPAQDGAIEVGVLGFGTPAISSTTDSTLLRSHIIFDNPNGAVGKINTSGSQTFYVTSSDYRLKTDIQPMQGSIDRVKALKPCNFEWVNGGTRVDGFIAHEAQEVVPEAVSGEKDATKTNKDGVEVPDYQGIDQSKLVPLLTSALQEALAKIDDLELRMANLEN